MKWASYIITIIAGLTGAASAANVWSGTNLYYAAGLSASQRASYFSALQNAGMKVLRVWLDGQSSASTKNTPITSYGDLESSAVGTYDDAVLKLLDTVMVDARKYGIKLIISMHSYNALSRPDIYGQWYGTGYFYEQATATNGFDNRIRHVMNHIHTSLGRPWKELSEYIFAFEAQNEAMIGKGHDYILAHSGWQCDRAKVIKDTLGPGPKILVMTGGASWMDESINDTLLNCPYLDVVSIHAYGTGDYSTSQIQPYVTRAVNKGKKLLFQEWGACYYSSPNERCNAASALSTTTRNNNISNWARQIAAAGVPWLYWQVLPNADPHYDWDYEIGANVDPSWSTLVSASQAAYGYSSPFDYSAYLP